MMLPAQRSILLAPPLLALVALALYGVFSLNAFKNQSFKKKGADHFPPSKSQRDANLKPSASDIPSQKDSQPKLTWITENALALGETIVLPDGTVIEPNSEQMKFVAGRPVDGPQSVSDGSDLRDRLLEKAGHLAIHSDDPWKSLILVATAYHKSGNVDARQFWFDRAIRLAVDPDNEKETSEGFRDVVKGFVSIGEIEQGLGLIHRIPLPQYRDLATAEIVKSIAARRDFERALTLTFGINDTKARHLALRGIAESQARYETVTVAMSTVSAIPQGKSRDDAIMRVALARASMGDSAGASTLVEKIKSSNIRDLALMRLADGATRTSGSGAAELYLSLLRDPFLRDELLLNLVEKQVAKAKLTEAQAAAARIESRADRAAAMELLVSLQVKQGDIRGALKRARAIDILAAHDRALQTVALQQVTVQGPPAARFTADLIKTPRARDTAYRRIAERTAALGQNRQIGPTIGEITNPSERASALASVAKLQARRGLLNPARFSISEAESEVLNIPNRKKQWKAMSVLATAHLETGDDTTAIELAAQIDDDGLRDQTYQQLSKKFAGLADIELAEETAHAIQKETTRERALDEVARVIAGRTRATEALGRLKKFEGRRQQVKFLLEVARRI